MIVIDCVPEVVCSVFFFRRRTCSASRVILDPRPSKSLAPKVREVYSVVSTVVDVDSMICFSLVVPSDFRLRFDDTFPGLNYGGCSALGRAVLSKPVIEGSGIVDKPETAAAKSSPAMAERSECFFLMATRSSRDDFCVSTTDGPVRSWPPSQGWFAKSGLDLSRGDLRILAGGGRGSMTATGMFDCVGAIE
jgi:hypothetical protein